MSRIFEQGAFKSFSDVYLSASRIPIYEFSQYTPRRTTVFISHKHDDLDDLKGVLGFLEKSYGVKVYIDSRDPAMPPTTSSATATKLKDRIKKCDKFLLLATNSAIESKWCNWELGFGDANKYQEHIALFPLKPQGTTDDAYKGSEYLQIYPYIRYFDGTERYKGIQQIRRGYYVVFPESDTNNPLSLDMWFKRR